MSARFVDDCSVGWHLVLSSSFSRNNWTTRGTPQTQQQRVSSLCKFAGWKPIDDPVFFWLWSCSMAGMPWVSCTIFITESLVKCSLKGSINSYVRLEHDRASLQSEGHDDASDGPRCVAMWRVRTVVPQRLPQTRWFELVSCHKSGTFVPDTYVKELHCNV